MTVAVGHSSKRKVLKKYPRAYSKEGRTSGDWYIYLDGRTIGIGSTAKRAWADALSRMEFMNRSTIDACL